MLHILLGYFESHTIYRPGASSAGRSPEFFRRAFTAVFLRAAHGVPPGTDPKAVSEWLADAMYSDARCGLFHDWMARSRIALTKKPELIRARGREGHIDEVTINVDKFLTMIETHFVGYVNELKDQSNTGWRAAFNAGWEITHGA